MKSPRHKGKDTYHTKRAKLAQQTRAERKAHKTRGVALLEGAE